MQTSERPFTIRRLASLIGGAAVDYPAARAPAACFRRRRGSYCMTSKVRRSRTVDFHTAVAKEMDRYLRKRQNVSPEAPLFPTDEGAFFKSTESFGNVFARIADDSGIRRFHAHLLRHTWATNWMKPPGADLLTLMRQGGWKRLQMVERYSHAIPVKDRAALPNPMAEAKIVAFSR